MRDRRHIANESTFKSSSLESAESGFTTRTRTFCIDSDRAHTVIHGFMGGIISGDVNGNFYPLSNATRAQAAKMVAVLLQVTGS